jgi:hypothetical protein
VPGATFVYEPVPSEDKVVNTVEVTDDIKPILGVKCSVVKDVETVDRVLTEENL